MLRLRTQLGLATFTIAGVFVVSCSDSGESAGGTSSFGGVGNAAGDASVDGSVGGGPDAGGSSGFGGFGLDGAADSGCQNGNSCGDGGICAGGECCAADRACGDECCTAADVCSFGTCVQPGSECLDSNECQADEYCDYSLGTTGGDAGPDAGDGGMCLSGNVPPTGRCLKRPPVCPDGDPNPMNCIEKCEVVPPPTSFNVVEKYKWGDQPSVTDVMMTPIVVQLDDDDCDGKITARDIPEIVFVTYADGAYSSDSTLHAISIVNGQVVEKFTVGSAAPNRQLAGGNIDAEPGNEIVFCNAAGTTTTAVDGSGNQVWSVPTGRCTQPAIADLDGDGQPEVIVDSQVLDGKTGATEAVFTPPMEGTFAVADVTGDGQLNIVSSTQIYDRTGAQLVDTGVVGHVHSSAFASGPAVADLDRDGKPEIISIYFKTHSLAVWQYDASSPGSFKTVRAGIDINGTLSPTLCPAGNAGSKWGGGPVTVGDFDGDLFPDVALAGGVGYAVFNGKSLMDTTIADAGTFLWQKQTRDCSSAGTGSSLFDFNGDGKAEVIYSDEIAFRIYEGATGNILYETCNTSHTLNEYPVVADVDNDGKADIVIATNGRQFACADGTRTSGIRVFGSANDDWVRTRRIWNQHAYQITNIEEDGTVPTQEPTNWTQPGLNNFRLNRQPGSEFAAPDAVVSLQVSCADRSLIATVRNLGEAALPPGVRVEFYSGTAPGGTKLGEGVTTVALGPVQAQHVVLQPASVPSAVQNGATPAYAVVSVPAGTVECREDNNTSDPAQANCGSVK